MPLPAKVDALKAEISGDQGFMARRDSQNRAIISDASR
jgi:hypothetical protein